MGRSIQLGTIFGIPFRLDYSWFIIFILVAVSLSYVYFPTQYATWPPAMYWVIGIGTSLLFFASVLAHELSHSLVSMAGGIPVKSITLFIFGGVAHVGREATRPQQELWMAAAGPLSSLAIAALFYGLYLLIAGINVYVAALALWLAIINAFLAVFNMIPGFPLDGGRVLRSIVWMITGDYMRATRIATYGGYGVSFLFLGGGIVFILLGGWFDGLWFLFLGWFLNNATRATYQQVRLRHALKGFSARDVMARECPAVSPHLTLREMAQGVLLTSHSPCFLVADDGRVRGMLTLRQVRRVPREEWLTTSVAQAMTPVEQLSTVRPDDDAVSVLERMEEERLEQAAVIEEGRVLGIVDHDTIVRFAQRLSELKM